MKLKAMMLAATAAALIPFAAMGHGGDAHPPKHAGAPTSQEVTEFGRAGDPAKATRTVQVDMSDNMRFTPSSLTVHTGETVRFVVHNQGKVLHEMVLGTDDKLRQHAALMLRSPEMEHAEAHMVHVPPGETGEMVWTFDRPGRFTFACLVPGHFEAGMKGNVVVQ
jgi:uncharacterized cupredoxin-like copper-binding protein